MNRYKPTGWRNDNYRHSLVARGYVKTKYDSYIRDIKLHANDRPDLEYQAAVNANALEKENPDLKMNPIVEQTKAEYEGKSYGDYDEYLRNKEKEEAIDILDAEETLEDIKNQKQHRALLEEMKTEKEFESSVQGRDAFAATELQSAEVNAPPLNNFLTQAMKDSWDYMSRPNESIVSNNPLSTSIRESFHDWMGPKKEILVGGRADGIPDEAFDPVQLKKGIKHEMEEHTKNPEIAKEISKDHEVEDPNYYEKLDKMENGYYG